MADVTIRAALNGPYLVNGPIKLLDADGTPIPAPPQCALCRCGASSKKPFCDGTHSKIGFQSAAAANPESKE